MHYGAFRYGISDIGARPACPPARSSEGHCLLCCQKIILLLQITKVIRLLRRQKIIRLLQIAKVIRLLQHPKIKIATLTRKNHLARSTES